MILSLLFKNFESFESNKCLKYAWSKLKFFSSISKNIFFVWAFNLLYLSLLYIRFKFLEIKLFINLTLCIFDISLIFCLFVLISIIFSSSIWFCSSWFFEFIMLILIFEFIWVLLLLLILFVLSWFLVKKWLNSSSFEELFLSHWHVPIYFFLLIYIWIFLLKNITFEYFNYRISRNLSPYPPWL